MVVQPQHVFTFNTRVFQSADDITDFNCREVSESTKVFGTANKLLITGTSWVDMNFMQFFGFGQVPVTDSAIAQNVSNLDVVVVMDRNIDLGPTDIEIESAAMRIRSLGEMKIT